MNDDGNLNMNYASSDEMNQNAVSSDNGEKLGSGSEDEGSLNKRFTLESYNNLFDYRRGMLEKETPSEPNDVYYLPVA